MRAAMAAIMCIWAGTAAAQPVLDPSLLPATASDRVRAVYRDNFLTNNLPRAIATDGKDAVGWAAGQKSIEEARAKALEFCASKGSTTCQIYAENLQIVWPGKSAPPPAPGPASLGSGTGYDFIPDERYIWHGPQSARGLIVWGHGFDRAKNARGIQPPSFLRPLNNAGYDVVRFDRDENWDGNIDLVVSWLRDGLIKFRQMGWKQIVNAGQSRGGINVLNTLKTPGLFEIGITTSAANTGTDSGWIATRGETYLYNLIQDVPKQSTRLMYIQFQDDPFAGDEDRRADRIRNMLGPKLGQVVLIDRPDGFKGHGAGATAAFGTKFGACILHFVMDANAPTNCDR